MTTAPEPRPADAAADLWRFAVALYGHPGMREACLAVQDDGGVDVPLLLWACWLAVAETRALTPADVDRAEAAVGPWRLEVVRPLRAVRRRLKTGPAPAPSPATDALRQQIQAAELAAERVQLEVLAGLASLGTSAAMSTALRGNLACLLEGDAAARVLALVEAFAQGNGWASKPAA